MNDRTLGKDSEAMPVDLKMDNPSRDRSTGANVSRESSFSSVELGASNSVSRESSFSSSGSGVFDADSPSHLPSISNSWRSSEDERISRVTDLQCERLHNARARYRKARDVPSSESSSAEQLPSTSEKPRAMITLKRPEVHGRSISEPELGLSPVSGRRSPMLSATSPDGLVISTPSPKGFIEYRLRSRSFTGSEHNEEDRTDVKDLQDFSGQSWHLKVPSSDSVETRKSTTSQYRGNTTNDAKIDKNAREDSCSEKGYAVLLKERDDLREERDNLKRECERLQCERDAMQLERDTLVRDKEQLLAELNNRNDIIHHLQDHVATSMRAAVVSSDEVTSAGSTIRQQRSQSEIRRPAFYLPGELPKKNSYTCL